MAQWTDCICVTARKTRRLGNVSEKNKFSLEILKTRLKWLASHVMAQLFLGYITDLKGCEY